MSMGKMKTGTTGTTMARAESILKSRYCPNCEYWMGLPRANLAERCPACAGPVQKEKMVIGPYEKKLITRRMANVMIPDGKGGPEAGLEAGFKALQRNDLDKIAKEACEWVRAALDAVRTAPDSIYDDDYEAIAEAILKGMK